jgi:hypothetical protein
VIEHCELFEAGSKTLNLTAFDQLFVAVTAGGKGEGARAINRQQWFQCLVRFCIMRHVATGNETSVPRALRRLIFDEMMPRVDRRALHDSYAFREEHCCTRAPILLPARRICVSKRRALFSSTDTQDVEEILSYFEDSLHSIYWVYARGQGHIGDVLDANTLLSYTEWRELVKDLELSDNDFTAREVPLVFVWSRMRVVDEDMIDSKVKVLQLSFTDFLEALVRMATMKALPTEEQIFDHDAEDAGAMLLKLRGDPMAYKRFLAENAPVFGEPLSQPTFKLVAHLCALIMHTVAAVVASAGDTRVVIKDMRHLTHDNVRLFKKCVMCGPNPSFGSHRWRSTGQRSGHR